jgi:ectoine hydroxylase-related dioxygenase (phytanoyl-CoA dioxygenase family)
MQQWLVPASAPVAEVKQVFDELGFVAIEGLVTPHEVAELHAAHEEGISSGTLLASKDDMADNYDTIFRHPVFERWVRDPRLVGLVHALIDRGVELQHVKYNAKPLDGGGEAPWHQDYPFFPHTNYDLLAVTIYFDDTDEANGAVRFIPGSHRWGELSHCDEEGRFLYQCQDQARCRDAAAVSLVAPAGTVTIHHCLTLHASGSVTSRRQRRLLIFQYRAEDNVQLAGVIWDSTGMEILKKNSARRVRFFDGTEVTLRGGLVDVFGNLKPVRALPSVRPVRT